MRQPRFPLHKKSRGPHPDYSVARAPVVDEQVPWKFEWKEYNPPEFTHGDVKAQPRWADPPDPADEDYRKQLLGRITTAICNPEAPGVEKTPVTLGDAQPNQDGTRNEYVIEFDQRGRPLNPHGRTGLCAYTLALTCTSNSCASPVLPAAELLGALHAHVRVLVHAQANEAFSVSGVPTTLQTWS